MTPKERKDMTWIIGLSLVAVLGVLIFWWTQ